MSKIIWKDQYNTGIDIIDMQHKRLLKLINYLSEEGEKDGMTAYIFEELSQYIKQHFKVEEDILKKSNYKEFAAHKNQHKEFSQWLRAVQQSYNIGGISNELLAKNVEEFLRQWLINHILISDMAYVSHLK